MINTTFYCYKKSFAVSPLEICNKLSFSYSSYEAKSPKTENILSQRVLTIITGFLSEKKREKKI